MLKQHQLVALLLIAAGCASQVGAGGDPALGAEGDRTAAPPLELELELAKPPRGYLLETGTNWIEPGDDVRLCEVVALPGSPSDTFYVSRIEAALSAEGDELIVHAARLGSETESLMEPGSAVPCTRAGEAFGEDLSDVLATQEHYTDELFPDGTGKVFRGGQKLALETHFLNETAEPLLGRAKLSLHLTDAERVQRIARTASFANFTIFTPPGGQSVHVGECAVREEVVIGELVRRTQRYATSFKVWFAGGARDGELVWDSQHRRDSRYEPPAPLLLMPGEGFRFECAYLNPTDRELRYGVGSADETCMLQAQYWSPAQSEPAPEGCLLFDVDSDGVARR